MLKQQFKNLQNTRDGRMAFNGLGELYEGVGVHSVDITKVDQIIATLFIMKKSNNICCGVNLKKN